MRRLRYAALGLATFEVAWSMRPIPPDPSPPLTAAAAAAAAAAAERADAPVAPLREIQVARDFSVARATSADPSVEASADGEAAAYWTDRVLVAIDPARVAEVADRHGLTVLRVAEDLGLARLGVPSPLEVTDVIDALSVDPDIERAFPAGRMVGAGKGGKSSAPVDLSALQWHFATGGAKSGVADVEGFTVAVLDSGVAYETYDGFVQAPSLASTPVVAPADFVNGDAHANDDHRHGTHIASVILSNGAIRGVAPGAALMPVKVLDEHNQGDELSLVEGLHHALDHGADVINMSLSFGPGFVPSAELLYAITRGEKAGVILVAAAGNAGVDKVTWPAASPGVIGVGAVAPRDGQGTPEIPAYSNLGAVDVMAPGGAPGVDRNLDGFADGLLAETFAPGAPADLGYWFQAGTSQAAAFVSGAAVQLLAAGASPDQVRGTLQMAASTNSLGVSPFAAGTAPGWSTSTPRSRSPATGGAPWPGVATSRSWPTSRRWARS